MNLKVKEVVIFGLMMVWSFVLQGGMEAKCQPVILFCALTGGLTIAQFQFVLFDKFVVYKKKLKDSK